jgi:DNA-binding NarL/FixJ family response regulator
MMDSAAIQVLMVEDHPAVRQGLRLLLEQEGIRICAEADSIEASLRCLTQVSPDLVMVDLHLGEEDGLDLVRLVTEQSPGLPLLVYSMFEDPTHVTQALQAGAKGYVTKREASAVLAHAIRECTAGRAYLSPRIGLNRAGSAATLSFQEQQVFHLLGEGHATSAIAAQLDLSPRTVESYYSRIQTKLGLSGMKALRQKAIRKHL